VELTHGFTVPASVDDAWAAFNDLERIAPCFPGASLTSYDGESFEGLVKVKLGPISLQYAGAGRFAERDEAAHRAVIEAKGKDKRGNGTAAATITASLTSAGDAGTDVTVTTDLTITGKPAQFGRGVMQDVSDKLLGQFASCLETKLGESATAAPGGTDEEGSAEPSASAEAAKHRAASAAEPEPVAALDVGAAVVPVLLKRYAPQIVGTIVGLWLLRKIFRRRR
jgi:carbon monoxide dehydrogenase subunit G